MRAPETMSPLGVIKPKAMKNDKGSEGGHKFGKMGRRRLWMAPKVFSKINIMSSSNLGRIKFCNSELFLQPQMALEYWIKQYE